MPAYWRIRLRNEEGDFTRKAWDRDEIGIWYGAWTADEFKAFDNPGQSAQQIARKLNELPSQQALIDSGVWDSPLSSSNVSTARRFYRIGEDDWSVIYLNEEKLIGLAQLSRDIFSDSGHPLNTYAGEIFKYRKILRRREFSVSDLPDAYRLVPAQGWGNVHQFTGMYEHVKLLTEHSTAGEIVRSINEMPFDQQLDLMGASAWESFSVAWLILERDFIPTGLSIEKTLKDIDIIGRNKSTGRRIIAQCKKVQTASRLTRVFVAVLLQRTKDIISHMVDARQDQIQESEL